MIDTHISRLRKKIDEGFDKPLLHTLRGTGYRLSQEGHDRAAIAGLRPRLRPWICPLRMLAVTALGPGRGPGPGRPHRRGHHRPAPAAVAAAARDYFVTFAHEEGLAPLAKALDLHEKTDFPAAPSAAPCYRRTAGCWAARGLLEADRLPPPAPRGRRSRAKAATSLAGHGRAPVPAAEPWWSTRTSASASPSAAPGAPAPGSASAGLPSAWSCWPASGSTASCSSARRALAATARRIADGDLSTRAETHPKGDVFDRLGEAVNAMLGRIDELMTGMRTVTDSLARTTCACRSPGCADLARAALEPGVDERTRLDAIEQAHAEADRSLATLSALMDIARAEAGLSREMMGEVDLSALVAEIGELFALDRGRRPGADRPATPTERVTARAARADPAPGARLPPAQRRLARRAGRRGAAGAGAHTRPRAHRGRPTAVPASRRSTAAACSERFVRLDAARSVPGGGLGLAIAAACAKLHGGTLELEDAEPGLRVVIDLADHD